MVGGVLQGWGKILAGYHPNLSLEITRECPLRCPGCYAYGEEPLGGGVVLRELADFKGQQLIDGVLETVRRMKPAHLSIVGGEPLVRFRALGEDSAAPGLRVDRRVAGRAQRAPRARHVRSHPETHRRPTDHGALHDHT